MTKQHHQSKELWILWALIMGLILLVAFMRPAQGSESWTQADYTYELERTMDRWETSAYALAIADTASTYLALRDGATEVNPLLGEDPSNQVLLASLASQLLLINWVNSEFRARDAYGFNVIYSTIKAGVVGNNIVILYGGEF